MRYVHMQCLQHWQAQLRATKGLAAARRCDVCKARWAKCYQPPAVPTDWRTMLRDVFRSVPWPAVLECWKFSVLAIGALQGVRAGVEGFRCGMQWAAGASRHNLEELARWAPEMALAAGTVPPLKAPMALCLVAFVTGLAAQVALMSIVCAWAGSVAGFASGVAGCLLATLQAGAALLRQSALAASAVASGAGRLAAAAGSLAAPIVMALLKTLAFTRLFA
ncbi:carbohydrate kinase [Chlorella sorokiniana]|uniref:Carbohydrate kinase n=1 Tax=Chlorella sorokiniana TaxID=3076 RepID=A0A2P6TCY1_CHLSO|nr:carbohydrate kinase [Chlorella sorokiniana]|eukprot:PRW20501.1 carbohydrate kinase [Chlorella sorokiniana]